MNKLLALLHWVLLLSPFVVFATLFVLLVVAAFASGVVVSRHFH